MGESNLNENGLDLAMAKYRYARVFLEYLETAKKLLDLQDCLPAVEPARGLVSDGRDIHHDYTEDSIAMERVLNPRRTIEKPMEGLEFAIGRFDVDVEIAKANEACCWQALVDAVNSVAPDESWRASPWYGGSMSEQHDLLITDARAIDRICHYQRELRDTLFEYTPSPDSLEVDFRLSYGKLVDVVPFSL